MWEEGGKKARRVILQYPKDSTPEDLPSGYCCRRRRCCWSGKKVWDCCSNPCCSSSSLAIAAASSSASETFLERFPTHAVCPFGCWISIVVYLPPLYVCTLAKISHPPAKRGSKRCACFSPLPHKLELPRTCPFHTHCKEGNAC